MALYAGQGVGSVRDVRPAAEVVQELAAGAEALMRRSDRIGA
jgi:NAD(P)H-dependent flavin oxidoreductase YrpB (nitropropane dioxygenase family)